MGWRRKRNLRQTGSPNKSEGEGQGVGRRKPIPGGVNQDRLERRDGEGGPRNGTKDTVHGFVWGEAWGVCVTVCVCDLLLGLQG